MLETRLLLSLRIVTSTNAALRLLLDASWLENKQLRITRGSKAHPKWRNVAHQSYVVIVAWKLLAAEVAFAAVIFYLPWLAPQGSLWGSIQITPYRLHACLVKPPSEIPRTFPWNWWKHMVLESSSLFQPESKQDKAHGRNRPALRAQVGYELVWQHPAPHTLPICPSKTLLEFPVRQRPGKAWGFANGPVVAVNCWKGSKKIKLSWLWACLAKPPSEIPRTSPWNWQKHMVLASSSLLQPESKRSTEHRVGIAQLPTGLVVPYTLLICPRHHLSFQSAKGLAIIAVVLNLPRSESQSECNGLLWRASCSLRDGSTWRLNHVTHANLGMQESDSPGHLKQRCFQFTRSSKAHKHSQRQGCFT